MDIPILALFFQGIPEQIAIVTLTYIIASIPLNWKKIMFIGTILAVCSYFVRKLPFTFGIHTIIIMGLLILFMIIWAKGDLNAILMASFISILTVIILEISYFFILMPIFQITPEMISTNWIVRTLMGLPQTLTIFLLSFIVYKKKRKRIVSKKQEGY